MHTDRGNVSFSDPARLEPAPEAARRLVDLVHVLRRRALLNDGADAHVERSTDARGVSSPRRVSDGWEGGHAVVPLVDACEREVVEWVDEVLAEVGPPRRVDADVVGGDGQATGVRFTISGLRGASARVFPLPGVGKGLGGADVGAGDGAQAAA